MDPSTPAGHEVMAPTAELRGHGLPNGRPAVVPAHIPHLDAPETVADLVMSFLSTL